MERKFFYLDKEFLNYEKLDKFRSWLLNYPIIVFAPFVLVICFLVATISKNNLENIEMYNQLVCEYNELVETHNREIDADTLIIKLGRAYLEGVKKIPFNDSIVYEYLVECRAWYPEYIMAQYKLESTSGTSDLAQNADNFVGMRPVKGKRKNFTTQRPGQEYKGYAKYDNWHLCLLDKILWDHFRFGGVKPDEKTYLAAHSRYAEDEEYFSKITAIAKTFK